SVRGGNLDATVQDVPAVRYYVGPGKEFADLRPVGAPVEPGHYVMFVRRTDATLRDRLNQALKEALKDGTLRRIYDKYGPWNGDQEQLGRLMESWPPDVVAAESSLLDYGWMLLKSAGVTVLLAFLSMPLAMLAGLLIAVGRLYGPRGLDWLLTLYVELVR